MRGAVQERYCAVYLPAFRIERMGYDGREPVCVVTEQHGVTRVLSLSPTAIAEGLHAGMTVTEARALLPELVAEPWDEEAESEDLGELVEAGPTAEIFTNPRMERTSDYITGRYG